MILQCQAWICFVFLHDFDGFAMSSLNLLCFLAWFWWFCNVKLEFALFSCMILMIVQCIAWICFVFLHDFDDFAMSSLNLLCFPAWFWWFCSVKFEFALFSCMILMVLDRFRVKLLKMHWFLKGKGRKRSERGPEGLEEEPETSGPKSIKDLNI